MSDGPHKASGEARTGRFPKGRSGNPGGRSKVTRGVREALEAGSVDAADYLLSVVRDDGAEPKDRIAASKVVLEFSVAKPKATADAAKGAEEDLASVNKEQLLAAAEAQDAIAH